MSIEHSNTMEAEVRFTPMPDKFLGWRIVGVAFLAQMFGNAVTLAAFSNFVLPLSESFAVPRNRITLGLAIAIGCIGVVSPVAGRWMDRGYARVMMTSGALLAGSGLLLMSLIEDLSLFICVFTGFVCIGAALFGVMPSSTLVANWFIRRRGFALGLTFSGATLISVIAPVSAQYLIDVSGWRTALQAFGIVVLAIGAPSFAFFVIGRPEDVGQRPDGEAADAPGADDRAELGTDAAGIRSVQELARDPRLWLISLGFGLILTSPIVLISLLIPYGESLGFAAQQTNTFLIVMAPFSLLGKLGLGTLADRAAAKPIIALVVVMNLLVWLVFYSEPSFNVFLLAGALYGIGIGGAAPVHGVVVGRCFGRVNFGTASGLGGILTIILLIMATLMSSILQGENGEGYPNVFVVQSVLLLFGGLVLAFMRIPTFRESADAQAV